MQEQDDPIEFDAHAKAALEILKLGVYELVDAVVKRNSLAASLYMSKLKCDLAALWVSFNDHGGTHCYIPVLTHRFKDRGKNELLTITPATPVTAYHKHGVYMAKILLAVGPAPKGDYQYEEVVESEAFDLDELKIDLANQLFSWWFHFETRGWDDSPLARSLRRLFQFTVTEIPGEKP